MKKAVIAVAAVLIIGILTVFLYLMINGDPTAYSHLEERVEQYLIEEKGYAADEIERLDVVYEALKAQNYRAEVVFTDEPQTTYLYCENNDEQIVQCGEQEVSSAAEQPSFKHRES